jgi:lysophospholipase L1-like esterase
VRFARPLVPVPFSLAAVLVALTALFLLVALLVERAAPRPRLRRLALFASSLAYGVALVESVSAMLLADRLIASPLADLYENALGGRVSGIFRSSTANFSGHPYLNFVLNPDALYKNERQFDARYHIRRKEPLRPRREVAWRALVLGGSTTFGQLLPDERDTWVYRLEQKMRAAHGPRYDVVNGGVSGYNVVDNFIHYVLLLDELEPDVVVLYVGINDVHARLSGDLVRDYSNSRIPWRAEANTLPLANPRLTGSFTYRYLLLLRIERVRLGHIFDFVQAPPDPPDRQEDALRRNGPEIFASHLRNLVRLIKAQGHQVILVPQVFLPVGQRDQTFAHGVNSNNAAAEAVAHELGVPFLADVASAFSPQDLVDNCHFNVDGSEKMAQILFPHLDPAPVAAGWHATPGRC